MTFNPSTSKVSDGSDDTAVQNSNTGVAETTKKLKKNITSETTIVRVGKCKWFNVAKGWGFVTPNDGGQEVFVHQSVIQMRGFRSLGEQEEVEFETICTERGLEATRVSGLNRQDCHGSTFRPQPKKRYRKIRCYNCGAFGNHIASDCLIGPQPKSCHNCRSEEHLIANCPYKDN